MQYFFDTSALVKLYHHEPGSETVAEIHRTNRAIIISELSKVEFLSTASKKRRTKEITGRTFTVLKDKFLLDCLEEFIVVPLVSSVVDTAFDLIDEQGAGHHLFSLDALQIAAFILASEDDTPFVCADRRLTSLVKSLGHSVLEL